MTVLVIVNVYSDESVTVLKAGAEILSVRISRYTSVIVLTTSSATVAGYTWSVTNGSYVVTMYVLKLQMSRTPTGLSPAGAQSM